jgi:FG-GAP-like repeat
MPARARNVATIAVLGLLAWPGSASALNFAQPPGSPYGVIEQPNALAIGDFNGDGAPDIVTANEHRTAVGGYAAILLNDGAGAFAQAPGSPIAVGWGPEAVTAGDVNGDGKADIVTAVTRDAEVSVLLGNGTGGFSHAPGSPFPLDLAIVSPMSIAVGDVSGDGKPDIATANATDDISILLGNGSGGFALSPSGPIPTGSFPRSLAIADLDGANALDLVVANRDSHSVMVLLSNGSGGFVAAPGSPIALRASSIGATDPYSVAVGDLNGDGHRDLATANFGHAASVLLGDGTGAFVEHPSSPTFGGVLPHSVAIGDVDDDGLQDLALASLGGNSATVMRGNGAGALSEAGSFGTGADPISIATDDLDGDGFLDLATVNRESRNVSVLLNRAGASVAPASFHDFGEREAGSGAGTERTFTIRSTGAPPLSISSLTLAGGNPGQYQLTGAGDCTAAPLGPGEECEMAVAFAPTSTGFKDATLTIASNVPGSPQTVSLFGEGVDRDVAVAPTEVDFGTGPVAAGPGALRTIAIDSVGTTPLSVSSVTLGGPDAGQFTLSDPVFCTVLEHWPGFGCEVEVAFAPTSVGPKAATLTVVSDAPDSPHTVALGGEGVPNPGIGVTPNGHDFGERPAAVGPGAGHSFSLDSDGTTPLTIDSVTLTGADAGDFQLAPADECTAGQLAPADGCEVEVAFAPDSTGAKAATLTVVSDAPGSPLAIPLTGEGLANPHIGLSPASHDFGGRAANTGASEPRVVRVENTGTTALTVDSIVVSGGDRRDFELSGTGDCTGRPIEPGDSCRLGAAFAPTGAGAKVATLEIASDAASSPHTATLAGRGLPNPGIALDPRGHGFGRRPLNGGEAVRRFEIRSTGTTALTVDRIVLAGRRREFRLAGADRCASAPIAPGASCPVEVGFAPSAAGARWATLAVTSDAPGRLRVATIRGIGVAPPRPRPALRLTIAPRSRPLSIDRPTALAVTVRNVGRAVARRVLLCARPPADRVRVRFASASACVRVQRIGPRASRTRTLTAVLTTAESSPTTYFVAVTARAPGAARQVALVSLRAR